MLKLQKVGFNEMQYWQIFQPIKRKIALTFLYRVTQAGQISKHFMAELKRLADLLT
jgi:hypothetical protein